MFWDNWEHFFYKILHRPILPAWNHSLWMWSSDKGHRKPVIVCPSPNLGSGASVSAALLASWATWERSIPWIWCNGGAILKETVNFWKVVWQHHPNTLLQNNHTSYKAKYDLTINLPKYYWPKKFKPKWLNPNYNWDVLISCTVTR